MFLDFDLLLSRLADALLRRVFFLTYEQSFVLLEAYLPGPGRRAQRQQLRDFLRLMLKRGMIRKILFETHLPQIVGPHPVFSWPQNLPTPPLGEKHRRRMPEKIEWQEASLYFATERAADAAGITPSFDLSELFERMMSELSDYDYLVEDGNLDFNPSDPITFQESVVDGFVIGHLNMAYVYLHLLQTRPDVTDKWQPLLFTKDDADGVFPHAFGDYPHAIRETWRGKSSMFFGGGLGQQESERVVAALQRFLVESKQIVAIEDW